jgi:hypothetical protein
MKNYYTVFFCLLTLSWCRAQATYTPYQTETRPRADFAHRAISINTGVPLKKGTLNWYNYYLLYNELEYGFSNRLSASLGYILIPGNSNEEVPLSIRCRYAFPINERLYFGVNYQSFMYFYRDGNSFLENWRGSDRLVSTTMSMTYSAPRGVLSLSGGLGRETGTSSRTPIVSLYGLYIPKPNGIFGLMTELNLGGEYSDAFNDYSSRNLLASSGVQLRGRAFAVQAFVVVITDAGYTQVIPGGSIRTKLVRPKG